MADQSRLTWALIVSVLLHGLLLTVLPFIRRAHLEIPSPPPLLDVDVLPMPKPAAPVAKAPSAPAPPQPQEQAAAPAPPPVLIPERQIVSPPDAGEEKEPENARLLSDRNNTVKEETVHRAEPAAGDPEAKPAPPPQEEKVAKAEPPAAPPKPQVAPRPQPARPSAHTQVASLPKLDQLLPPAGDLIRDGLVKPEAAPPAPAPQQQASVQRNDLLRHGDPWRSGGLRGGSLDFLPSVREGDITMLNTKAEQFAPFVRRVAVRVFENFRILLRRSLDARSAESGEEFATIEAVMDKKGRLLSIQAKDRSVNAAMATDRNLQAATQEGFFDRNPPPGAESSDGNIHFIFAARVGLLSDPGRGVVGYRALFQAGLL